MSTQKPVLHFVRLATAARELGAVSKRVFVRDLRTLSDRERREIADILAKREG